MRFHAGRAAQPSWPLHPLSNAGKKAPASNEKPRKSIPCNQPQSPIAGKKSNHQSQNICIDRPKRRPPRAGRPVGSGAPARIKDSAPGRSSPYPGMAGLSRNGRSVNRLETILRQGAKKRAGLPVPFRNCPGKQGKTSRNRSVPNARARFPGSGKRMPGSIPDWKNNIPLSISRSKTLTSTGNRKHPPAGGTGKGSSRQAASGPLPGKGDPSLRLPKGEALRRPPCPYLPPGRTGTKRVNRSIRIRSHAKRPKTPPAGESRRQACRPIVLHSSTDKATKNGPGRAKAAERLPSTCHLKDSRRRRNGKKRETGTKRPGKPGKGSLQPATLKAFTGEKQKGTARPCGRRPKKAKKKGDLPGPPCRAATTYSPAPLVQYHRRWQP